MTIIEEDIENMLKKFDFSGFRNKTILITGASGLLGSLCVKVLSAAKKNIRIIATSRNLKEMKKENSGKKNILFYPHDVRKPLDVKENIDYIIHAASPTSSKSFVEQPVEVIDTIVNGTRYVLELAKTKKVSSMVFLSSLEVYGVPTHEKIVEKDSGYIDSLNVRSSYSEGKRLAETLCASYEKEYNVPVKIARLSQTFGAGVRKTDGRVFAQFARSIIEKKDIILHTKGDTKRNYCYTTDAVLALFTILLKGENGEAYNIANSHTYCSIFEMAKMLENDCSKVKLDINDKDYGYNPSMQICLDSSKLRKLGWKPQVNMKEMFSRLIDSMKEKY